MRIGENSLYQCSKFHGCKLKQGNRFPSKLPRKKCLHRLLQSFKGDEGEKERCFEFGIVKNLGLTTTVCELS